MNVIVYRSLKKNNCYLYVPSGHAVDSLPDHLLALVGNLEKALEFDLHPKRRTALGNAVEILADLERQGFHLQLSDPEKFLAGMSAADSATDKNL